MAFDFAVTSGMRHIPHTIHDASSALTAYEDFKKSYLDTESACNTEGVAFCPMIMEAVGGSWGPAANKVLAQLAKDKALLTGEREDIVAQKLLQLLGFTLHRENACAVLRRSRPLASNASALLLAATSLQADAAPDFS